MCTITFAASTRRNDLHEGKDLGNVGNMYFCLGKGDVLLLAARMILFVHFDSLVFQSVEVIHCTDSDLCNWISKKIQAQVNLKRKRCKIFWNGNHT